VTLILKENLFLNGVRLRMISIQKERANWTAVPRGRLLSSIVMVRRSACSNA
jgi:hypothetical protein